LSRSTTRSWGDADGDFVPDCDLIDPFSNGECGAMANSNFGQPVATTTEAPELISGWGKRLANWELSASVQHELAPRVGLNVGYYRRWFKNFTITDNLATGAADYSEFSVTAPVDPRLPEGGGYVISGLYDLNPDKVGQVDNYTTFARDYGDQVHNWHGVDATINMRLDNGLMLQGGMSTGRTLTDNCGIHAQLPEVQGDGYEAHSLDRRAVSSGLDSNPFCRVETPFLTQFKALGTYTVPRLDVLLAATVISFPGPERLANYVVPSSQVEASLGRPLSGGAANVTVPLFRPGQEYGERAAMIDLRVGKILRFAGLRTVLNLDIYNALNSNEVTAETHNYGTSGSTWLRPIAIVGGRLFKFSVQADF
jgi:hypothetical protein